LRLRPHFDPSGKRGTERKAFEHQYHTNLIVGQRMARRFCRLNNTNMVDLHVLQQYTHPSIHGSLNQGILFIKFTADGHRECRARPSIPNIFLTI